MNEVVKHSVTDLAKGAERQPTMLEVIAAAARDPQVDVAKMTELLALKERIEARDAEVAFNQAMTRLQAKLPKIIRTRKIEVKGVLRSKYAAFEDIDSQVRPLMIEEGFSASYTTEEHGQKETKVTCTIRHQQGHKESYSVVIPFDSSQYRSDAQSQGSTISFGKRYAFCLGMNITIVGEDNDAQGSYITQDQQDSLNDLITECGMHKDAASMSKFLEYMGVKTIAEIYAKDAKKAFAALEAKRRKMGQ